MIALFLGCVVASAQTAQPRRASRSTAAHPTGSLSLPTAAMNSIDPEHIRANVKFLASDFLEGRGTGQRGGDLAAAYIATQFALAGLRPAGDNGSFLQKVQMMGVATQPETTLQIVPSSGAPMNLRLGDDFVATNETLQPASDIDADIVFVGYGIEAPEYKWNDFKDVDVRGKVLLMLVNEPPSNDPNFFKGPALTYYGRWTYKYEEGARKGAVGVLLVHKTDMASYGWSVVHNSWGGERSYLRDQSGPRLKEAGWVQLEVARKMLAASGKNLDELMEQAKSRDFRPVPLSLKLQAHMVSKVRPFESNNVVGELPGTDSALGEAVMFSAHYDHFGIGPPVNGDAIYHGAADNATGTAMLLEMARAIAAAGQRPRRSLIFASVTGEEQGLLGSAYLGMHPPIPASHISLGLNFDNITPFGVPEEVEVSGSERTSFYPVVEEVAKDFKLEIKPDSQPNAGHYYRSDHFSLARVGIPAFSIGQGDKFQGHDSAWGLHQKEEYTAKRYHQPGDVYRDDMDFRGDALLARFGFALGWKAANEPAAIAWVPGDEFEAARKASQK